MVNGTSYFRLSKWSPGQIKQSQGYTFFPRHLQHYKFDPDESSFMSMHADKEEGQETVNRSYGRKAKTRDVDVWPARLFSRVSRSVSDSMSHRKPWSTIWMLSFKPDAGNLSAMTKSFPKSGWGCAVWFFLQYTQQVKQAKRAKCLRGLFKKNTELINDMLGGDMYKEHVWSWAACFWNIPAWWFLRLKPGHTLITLLCIVLCCVSSEYTNS